MSSVQLSINGKDVKLILFGNKELSEAALQNGIHNVVQRQKRIVK